MESYSKKLYNFITKEENFELAHEIHQSFYDITAKLVQDFWKAVYEYIRSNHSRGYIVKLDLEDSYELYVYKRNWKFSLAYQDILDFPKLGIFIDDDVTKRELKALTLILTEDSLLDKLDFETFKEEYLVAGHSLRENFEQLSFQKRILPNNREEIVKIFGDRLIKKLKILERNYKR